MGIFSWIQKHLSNQSKKRINSDAETVEPYISPDRDMQEFEEQAQHFPSMRIDKRLMKPLDEGLLPGEIILLDWSNHKSEDASIPAYFEYDYGLNATIDRHKLIRLGYLAAASPSESLKSLRVSELKDILRDNGQKVSGKKLDLIQRIIDNIDENLYSAAIMTESLVCTPAGNKILEKYSHLVWAHKHNSKDGIINVANALTQSIEEMQSKLDYSRSLEGLTEQSLEDIEDSDYYQIMGTLDKTTCPVCGTMDGKIFPTKDAKPGINLPPFHDGCRCTAGPYFADLPVSSERWYRDPVTDKGETGPNINYKNWKKKMIQKYGPDVFK